MRFFLWKLRRQKNDRRNENVVFFSLFLFFFLITFFFSSFFFFLAFCLERFSRLRWWFLIGWSVNGISINDTQKINVSCNCTKSHPSPKSMLNDYRDHSRSLQHLMKVITDDKIRLDINSFWIVHHIFHGNFLFLPGNLLRW